MSEKRRRRRRRRKRRKAEKEKKKEREREEGSERATCVVPAEEKTGVVVAE
jgi:hypothetical protein